MRIIALDNYDNHVEGEEYECSNHQAQQLIKKGLAKAAPAPKNKMMPAPQNKADPSSAAGGAQQSSASQAAQASPLMTAEKYPGGGLVIPDPQHAAAAAALAPRRGRRSTRGESSS